MELTERVTSGFHRLSALLAPSGWPLTAYISIVVVMPLVLGWLALTRRSAWPATEELVLLLVLGASALALERSRTNLFGDSEVSVSFVPMFAAAILFGPAEAAAVGGVSMYLSLQLFERGAVHKVLLSAGAVAIAAFAGAGAFQLLTGSTSSDRILQQLAPALGSGLLIFLVNSVVVTGAISIAARRNPVEIWVEKFKWLAPHYLALSASAYAMAMSYLALGVIGVTIFALPAAVLWLGVRQYSDRTRSDVLRLQKQSEVLSRSEERFRSLVEHAPGIVAVVNADGTMQSLILDRGAGGTFRRSQRVDQLDTLVHAADLGRFRAVLADIQDADADYAAEVELRLRDHPEGDWRQYVAVLKNLSAMPAVGGIVVTAHDVTEQKGLEQQLRHQAFHDPLTQLPNRALFTDRLEHALETVNSRGGRVAVMYVDLDRFKTVNDTFGHHIGDDLLVAVAQRLTPATRAGDTCARFGGDEFTVVLDGVEDEAEVEVIASRIQERIAEPIEIRGQRILVTASIGVAISQLGVPISARDLTRNADVALFHAKEEGRARTEIFSDELDPYTIERYQLERDLREAVEKEELVLFYQPEVDMVTRQVIGFEALVRWEHPTRGLVPPDEFIPLAEDNGTITDLGRWVLDEACRQAADWQERLFEGRHFTMGVNLSAGEFFESDLLERVSNALETTGLNPASLRIEITESVLLGDSSVADTIFHDLKDLGVELAIDDFGTGYSSFGYLRRLPADIIKVDRSFISSIDRDERDISIVRAVLAVADALGMGVTVEGIEREEQAAIMIELGARHSQGYLFSKPCNATDAETFVLESAGERDAA